MSLLFSLIQIFADKGVFHDVVKGSNLSRDEKSKITAALQGYSEGYKDGGNIKGGDKKRMVGFGRCDLKEQMIIIM